MTSLKGNLSSVDLANIFQMLSMNQREGTLWIFDGQSRKAIYFGQDGVSMLTRGKHKPVALGRILIRNDLITPEQLQDALRKQEESESRLLGQVLVEQGFVTRQEVEEALRTQIEEEVYSLFIWKDAQFEFLEGPPDEEFMGDAGVARLTFSVNSLIMEAAKRVDEWEWIQKVVPESDAIFRYTGRNVALEDEIFAAPWAGKVLAAVDGKRSVDEIIDASCVARFETTKMLALLLEGGAVEPLPVPELRKEAQQALSVGDTDQAVKFLTRLVALKGDTPEMHRQLAEVFEGRRHLERAAFHYKVYAEILADQGDRVPAFETYLRICDLLPTDLAAADRLIEIFASNPDGLEQHTTKLVAKGKLLAEVYVELGRQSRAVQVLHRVVALGPEDQDLRQRLIQVYLQSGMPGEAIAEYDALAESALAVRDFDTAERIYKKILQIDRTREDAQAKLNHILSRRKMRQRGIRLGVAAGVLLVAGAWGGFMAWKWYQDQKQLQVQAESAFSGRLADLRGKHQTVHDELDQTLKSLSGALREPPVMAQELRNGAKARSELLQRAAGAVQEYHVLAGEYPAVGDVEDARDAAQGIERKVNYVNIQEDKLRKELTRAVDDLFDKLEPWPPAYTLVELDRMLREINQLAEAVPQWQGGEKGARAQAYARNVSETLKAFEDMRKDVAALEDRADVAGAQNRIISFLVETRPGKDLLDQVSFPRTVVSRPAGARIVVDDRDTGLVTPAVLRLPVLQKATVRLDLAGFFPAEIAVAALEQLDHRRIAELLRPSLDEVLHKKAEFTTPVLPSAVVAPPAVAGDMVVVPTRGNEAAVFDAAGQPRGTLATRSANGVQSQPAVVGDMVVLATYDGTLLHYALSGEFRGRETLPGKVQADPVVWRESTIFADVDGHLTSYDVRRQSKTWTYPRSGGGRAPGFLAAPVVDGDEIFATTADGTIYVVHAADGSELRSGRPREEKGAGPVLATGVRLAGSCLIGACRPERGQTRILLIDRKTLEVRSSFVVDGNVRSAPVWWQGFAYAVTDDGTIWSVRTVDDRFQSAQQLKPEGIGRVSAEPALADGVLYVGDSLGTLWAVDVRGAQPERLFDFRIPGSDRKPVPIVTRPVVTDRWIVFAAYDRAVYGLRR